MRPEGIHLTLRFLGPTMPGADRRLSDRRSPPQPRRARRSRRASAASARSPSAAARACCGWASSCRPRRRAAAGLRARRPRAGFEPETRSFRRAPDARPLARSRRAARVLPAVDLGPDAARVAGALSKRAAPGRRRLHAARALRARVRIAGYTADALAHGPRARRGRRGVPGRLDPVQLPGRARVRRRATCGAWAAATSGATNVMRSAGRRRRASLAFVLDAAKGAPSRWRSPCAWLRAIRCCPALAAVAAVVGHMYPVWLRLPTAARASRPASAPSPLLAPVAALGAVPIFGLIVATHALRLARLDRGRRHPGRAHARVPRPGPGARSPRSPRPR